VGIDLVVVVVFVAIGRNVHDHGINAAGIASTAWPFSVGLAAGWLSIARTGRTGTSITDGAIIAVTTVAVGMALRVVSGQGIAAAFVIVALCFLGGAMIAWRGALRWRRSVRPSR